MSCDLTILTYPVNLYGNAKYLFRQKILHRGRYGGHKAVTRSIIEGLEKNNYNGFNYQPFFTKEISSKHVHVLAGIDTLEYAIKLKEKGRIKRLTAGPNIFTFGDESNYLINNKNIDMYYQPSKNTSKFFSETVSGIDKNKLDFFPAGVDTNYFMPNNNLQNKINQGTNKVLIYHKYESVQFRDCVCNIVKRCGYNPIIITYGQYDLIEFKKYLDECIFSIFISCYESQGICLQEAWSMDVPTFVFDPGYWCIKYKNLEYILENSQCRCPYLTKETGLIWKEFEELKFILSKANEMIHQFNPRRYCIDNFSDEVCAKNFLHKIV